MKIGKSHLLAFTIGLIPFVGAMYFLNREPIGPEVKYKNPYLGCYGVPSRSVLKLDDGSVMDLESKKSTVLKRILSVKRDDSINTERELFFDPSSRSLEIGDRDTGFFYVFRQSAEGKALVLYDRQGRSHQLLKRSC